MNSERAFLNPSRDLIGFIGLGVMGHPMAMNLAKAGKRLMVWNRSVGRTEHLRTAGAIVAENVAAVFSNCHVVFLMLVNEEALDTVLGRGTPEFEKLVSARVIVSMGSNAPEYSRALAQDIQQAGGYYVEVPVSGSRTQAETGQLVCLLGGEADLLDKIRPLLAPMCKEMVTCGKVGDALLMKLAINLYLNTMLIGLAEAMHFVDRNALDLRVFEDIVNAGPMACEVVRVKIPKIAGRDFSVQAATADALNSTRLIADVARAVDIATPLLDLASRLYGESVGLGNGRLDMTSVLMALEARSDTSKSDASEIPSLREVSIMT